MFFKSSNNANTARIMLNAETIGGVVNINNIVVASTAFCGGEHRASDTICKMRQRKFVSLMTTSVQASTFVLPTEVA